MDIIKEIANQNTWPKITWQNMQVTEYEKNLLSDLKVAPESEVVANRFSGEKATLCPEAVALYDVIMGCELLLNQSYDEAMEERFFAAKTIFCRNWPDEYMTLLD